MRLKPTAKNTVGGKIFPEFFDYECEETPLEHERIPTHPRQDGAAKSLERYLSIRDEIRSAEKKNWRSTVALRQSLCCCLFLLRRRI